MLRAEHLGGTIALLEPERTTFRCSDALDCTTRTTPASTFKIVNSILAFESGVAEDLNFSLPWDGTPAFVPACEGEIRMLQAYQSSCVPFYQEVARRIGLPAMREGVRRLGYGNAEVGSVVDRFWLDGPLAVSPVEQIQFLRRLEEGQLPINAHTRELMRELMIREQRGNAVLRGKTGWAHPNTPDERGWFVGYVEDGGRTAYVVVRATREPTMSEEDFLPARVAAAVRALESIGMF